MLRGNCRHCGAAIGWFHPAIELAALAIAAAALVADGNGALIWIDSALGWALLCAAWIDAETLRLPDNITLPLILAGLAVTWWKQPDALFNHAAAASFGYLCFRLLDRIYISIRHHPGLGAGDAKLLAAAGAWLGLAPLPNVVLGGALIGVAMALLSRRPGERIAFGPALAISFFLFRLIANQDYF